MILPPNYIELSFIEEFGRAIVKFTKTIRKKQTLSNLAIILIQPLPQITNSLIVQEKTTADLNIQL